MFDEWYAQSSFAETVTPTSPQKEAESAIPVKNESVETVQNGAKEVGSKSSVALFEKTVIIRPKSVSDMRKPDQNDLTRLGDIGSTSIPQLGLRVEQDLEIRAIQTVLRDDNDFEVWVDSLHEQLESAGLEKYLTYRAVLEARLHLCNTVLSRTQYLLSILNKFKLGFLTVADQTSSFQAQCDSLVREEERLSSYADNLAQNLHPFESLEPISRQLNAPGADFVTKPDFIESLKRIDHGLMYFKENADFKDAELYEMRFRHCLTRALTMVRVHFVNAVKDIANDINQRIAVKAMNETTQSALLYAKFRSKSAPLKTIVQQVEQRSHDEEYASLLNDCYQAYFGIRVRLITPVIMNRMAEISGTKDICRSAFSFLRGVCVDEYELFFQFFTTGEREFYRYLLSLSEPLYDHVRPRIIHETQIIALSELCLLFQTQFMRDPDEAESTFLESPQLDFGSIVQSALQDAQSRLVFRTENLIVNEIQNFVPKDVDLDYPRLLHESGSAFPSTPSVSSPILSALSPSAGKGEYFDSGMLFKGWYPSLRLSIWILSKIYKLINSAVFDDLAHRVVHLCIHSLFNASTLLASKKLQLDADLFLIKHLLILKEQIGAFDIEYVHPETEINFSRVVKEISTGSIFSPTILRRVVQLPVVVENMLDAKEELDGKLRIAINKFTNTTAEGIVSAVAGRGGTDMKVEDVRLAADKFRETAERLLPSVQEKTEEYLRDARTTDILINAVMENALTGYEKFYDEVERSHGKLAGEIWDVHTLATWLNGLVATKDGARDDTDDDVASNAGSEGRLERDFESP